MEAGAANDQVSRTSLESPAPQQQVPQPLQCLEILGGNQAVRHSLSGPGMEVWIDSRPYAGGRGGDLHYVSMCGSGRVTRFIVADISGHGPDMDEFAQWLRKMVRRYINLLDQTSFARALNKALAGRVGEKKFATVLLATYFAPTHHLIVCNAGHPPPLWYSHLAGRWQYLDAAAAEGGPSIRDEHARYRLSPVANLPLGIIESTEYRQFAAKLAMDDVVIIYTDAMTEARNPAGEMLGNRGWLELVQRTVRQIPGEGSELEAPGPGPRAAASPVSRVERHELRRTIPDGSPAVVAAPRTAQLIGQKLIEAVDRWRGDSPSEDDQTTIVLHHHGGPAPRLTLGRVASSMAKMLGLRWG